MGSSRGIVDLDVLLFQFDDLGAGEPGVLGLDLFACLYHRKADRAPAVLCWEYSGDEVGLYPELVAGFYADEIDGYPVAVEADPGVDYIADGAEKILRGQYGAGGLAAEVSLREVIGDAGGVVHVSVG